MPYDGPAAAPGSSACPIQPVGRRRSSDIPERNVDRILSAGAATFRKDGAGVAGYLNGSADIAALPGSGASTAILPALAYRVLSVAI